MSKSKIGDAAAAKGAGGVKRGSAEMEPFIVFFLLPVLFGVVAELLLRDTRHASLLAGTASCVLVYVCLELRDPEGAWNWLAALLVSPLVIAFSLTAVLICYGRTAHRHRGNHA